ncbi:HAMP domain-containing histidine kinase [Sphingomonas populi]|uniref:histidine kinase n=1 Tax=Sphingomonas populi TaxID=2484750 RepID=A0A4Q6XY11_9SPHN|nr:ATP-binding protein [Sphingomonas populi]RZF65693.1 HAMP domain-containing histidine kinase [Sphingomonas populi]
MFALTTIIAGPDTQPRIERGTLHVIPVELRSNERLQRYCALAKPGWSVDDWGYNMLCRYLPSGERLIIPGLELTDGTRARRRFHGHGPKFTKVQVEDYASSIVEFAQQEARRIQSSLNALIHDLRSLSTTILHSNNEAKILLQRDIGEAEVRIGNVEAAQGILRMRIDAFDLLSNPNAITTSKYVPLFKKVDKVVRFFKSSAGAGKKRIFLSGSSHRYLHGPDVFELVPFSLIDNAVKYSPVGSVIRVDVTENDRTRITITSLGPRINKSEESQIFLNGVRGTQAIQTGLPGTGVGLHLTSKIVRDFFKGDVWVQQSQAASYFDSNEFFETTFTVDVPTHLN